MSTMNRECFEKLAKICRRYDPFIQYIDVGYFEAKAGNERLDEEFNGIVSEFFEYKNGVPCFCRFESLTDDAINSKLTTWLAERGVEVEMPSRRVWTEQEIKELVQTNDTVLYGALKKLYDCQTADEQDCGETREHNGVGFNGVDAGFLSSTAEFLKRTGFLTSKQKAIVRKKLVKYNRQLTRLANS